MPEVQYSNGFDRWVATSVRPFIKGWMEIVRNAFVVAALAYVARKSENGIISMFSLVTTIMFVWYCLSYIIEQLPVANSTANNRYVRAGITGIIVMLNVFVFYSWSSLITRLIDELVKSSLK
jgi:hypothetical protein